MSDKQKAFPINTPYGDPTLYSGMDLRDYFACHASEPDVIYYQEKIANEINKNQPSDKQSEWQHVPREAAKYRYADAMIKWRGQ